MIKPVVGHATLKLDPEADPLPAWRNALGTATSAAMIKLLVDISTWAKEHPQSATALTLHGDAYLQIKQPYAAEKAYRQALSNGPMHAPAREGLGLALLQTGQAAEASKHLGKAHELDPGNPEILVHWGLALVQLKNLKAAHNRFQMALDRNPDNAHAWLNLGLVDTHRGAWLTAIGHFQQALARKPDFTEALHNLALACRHTGDMAQAIRATTLLTELHGHRAANWVLLAELHLNNGELELARLAIQRAIEVEPGHSDIYITQATLCSARREYADAEGVLKTALALTRDDPNARLEMGHLHLLLRRFDTGWDLHEARKHIAQSPVRHFPLPEWEGEPLAGRTVLVHAEQGLGDTIMFAHCLPDLLRLAGHVVIEVSTRLAPLFARSFPQATVVGRDPKSADLEWLKQLPRRIDCQIPIGSLPRYFRREASQFAPHQGYLRADEARTEHWRDQLAHFRRPVVGLAWRGGLPQTGREQRSVSTETLMPFLSNSPVQWISLQYGDAAARDIANLAQHGVDLPHWPETLTNQDEVAALTCALDAVVTVCSTQAHLTGALGRPGWVLTPFSPNWRYGAEDEVMPWYPSLRLLRQTSHGDWTGPLAALQRQLAA